MVGTIMIRNNMYWAYQIKVDFIPGIDFFSRCLEEKIVPAFDSIENEADAVEREAFENQSDYIDPENYDPADAAENAFERGLEYYQWMKGTLQGVINLFTAGLYHLLEQQLLLFYRQELLSIDEKNNMSLLEFNKAKSRLLTHGINIENFESWLKIDELRLVANTVKHADGSSAQNLQSRRPDLFSRSVTTSIMNSNITLGPVFTPLTGDSVYITQSEFKKYVSSVKKFWKEMCVALEEQIDTD